jgi:alpha-glucosidase
MYVTGNQPAANVQFYSSRGTLLKFARLSRMFAAMKNYTRHVVNASSVTGLAAQRPLFINYPNDTQSYDVKYEYLYGDDVIVAPVYLPNVEAWEVYLPFDPEAEWVFLWDESIVSGGGESVRVPAPLGHPPVFYRSNSVFVSDFRQVAAEPLVKLPPYVPEGSRGAVGPRGANGGSGGVVGLLTLILSLVCAAVCSL